MVEYELRCIWNKQLMRQQKPRLRVHFSERETISRSGQSGIKKPCIIPFNTTEMVFDYLKANCKDLSSKPPIGGLIAKRCKYTYQQHYSKVETFVLTKSIFIRLHFLWLRAAVINGFPSFP